MTPFGDRAIRFPIPSGRRRSPLRRALAAIPGVSDVVLAEAIGCVLFAEGNDPEFAAVEAVLADGERGEAAAAPTRRTIHVVYDGEDLDAVATAIGRSRDDVVRIHTETEYHVAMLGFLPGFAYLRGLAPALQLPRRAPRPRVPAGSVAIAAQYTGIYPFASPGGWHLLGRAVDFEPFGNDDGAAFGEDDTVRFVPTREAPPARAPTTPPPRAEGTTGAHLEIVRAAGAALLVDRGRRGRMHEGIPPGGPLVRTALACVNAAVGNEPFACAIEVYGKLEVAARGGHVAVADDAGVVDLGPDERHVVATHGRARVGYLAIGGGIDAPIVLGSRGALLVPGLGRLLRKGDRLSPLPPSPRLPVAAPRSIALSDGPIAIRAGPDRPPGFALEALTGAAVRIAAASDRTGTRLEGAPVAVDPQALAGPSLPMVIGAIELTPSGLIVLGPDHPTTGGYPVVAIVASDDLDRLFARPIGAAVRLARKPPRDGQPG